MHLVNYWIRPLALDELAEDCPGRADLGADDVIRAIAILEPPTDLTGLKRRYKLIRSNAESLFVAPRIPLVMDKLIWPLRSAVTNFVCGSPLGAVALSGVVGEMVAMLLYRMAEEEGREAKTGPAFELLRNRPFERLGQEDRVHVLHEMGLLSPKQRSDFGAIRSTRRRYLHLLSTSHGNLDRDSQICIRAASRLVCTLIGQETRGGKLVLEPAFARFLVRQGVLKAEPEQGSTG